MTTVASSLGTTQDYIPLVNATQLGKAAGLHMHFATLTALNAAITVERGNITASSPTWADGQPFSVTGEFGARRVWNATSQHARTVYLAGSFAPIVLAADSNTLSTTTGVPSGGNDGDVKFNQATGYYFTKTSGTWAPTGAIPVAGDPQSLTYTAGQLTGYTKNGVSYTLAYVSGLLSTIVGGGVTVTYSYSAGQLTGTVLS